MIGKVSQYDSKRGFGFIENSQGQRIFVHYTAIEDPNHQRLSVGSKVRYAVARGPRGFQAVKVVPLLSLH